jgi:hypothetical protein
MSCANGRTSVWVNLVNQLKPIDWRVSDSSLCLPVDLDKQDSFDCDSSVRVHNVVAGSEVLNKDRKDREELVFCELPRSAVCSLPDQ